MFCVFERIFINLSNNQIKLFAYADEQIDNDSKKREIHSRLIHLDVMIIVIDILLDY